MKNAIFYFVFWQKIFRVKRSREKWKKERELLESLVEKERLEDGELIQIPENVVRLQVVMGCIKQYKNLLQSEKRNSVNIAYSQGCILLKFKESKEFINIV